MKDIKRLRITELLAKSAEYVGKEIDVKGWVRTRRGNKNVQFVALNDGSTIKNLQIVAGMLQELLVSKPKRNWDIL